jgi:hypothetical protein
MVMFKLFMAFSKIGLFFYAKVHPAFIIAATGILGVVLR